ncbi:enoyl-CoA hydratase/isomerase family protein [Rhizobium sp. KVB221]|uniref:Enoyl-CoA hydratase/isomerase family protein n=1 Tax=Rhizobium setariae TaxID=2801340 RepID=A0A936YPM1_9HYPH|nr:3-hydroxyacyl-CoA dehydrogenase NAD-binding domain-containing protein [Rhizobium setariae]MBL0372131.1 enoyl-CoA hydratase/isomerase family protein [Rhizobium setariae]
MVATITRDDGIAVVTIDNPPVNALSQALRQTLWDAAEELEADESIVAVVLTCTGRTFIAGADVNEFGKPPQPPYLPDVVARIERSKKPWVAAIHGSALGGGFEVAMACLFRVSDASASVGMPEVRLGLVPGAGGTVRLPRLTTMETAVELVTTGSSFAATDALEAGLIDTIIDGDLRAGAVEFARQALENPLPLPLSERPAAQPEGDFWIKAEKAVAARARREEAPLRALACLRKASEADFEAAMAFERETFLALRASPQAAALRHVFFAERAASRPPEISGVPARDIGSAAVVGGGTMGAGIAVALRDAGFEVRLVERDAAAVERGLGNVAAIYGGSVKRGRLSAEEVVERVKGVHGTEDYNALADTDLVIEAVFEDLEVKREVFNKLAAVCRPDAMLATNTSYLDPASIAAGMEGPERFLGLHFFSPANVMKLLEIVPTGHTAPDVLATGFALARKLGKIPVRAGICDGFIGNRILKVTRAQAEQLLLSGIAPHAVDAAMRAFGMPMGPFEAQDLGGLDIAAFQRRAARDRGETPFAPVADRLCAMERFGQKSGGGWYDYVKGERTPLHSETVERIIGEEAGDRLRQVLDDDDIVDCIVLPMVNEGAKILADKVALRPSDIDLVEIHGYGFPRWRGGLMHYAQARGLADIVAKLESMSTRGLSEEPCALLRSAASAGEFPNMSG